MGVMEEASLTGRRGCKSRCLGSVIRCARVLQTLIKSVQKREREIKFVCSPGSPFAQYLKFWVFFRDAGRSVNRASWWFAFRLAKPAFKRLCDVCSARKGNRLLRENNKENIVCFGGFINNNDIILSLFTNKKE